MRNNNKLSLVEKISYGSGDFASSIFWALFSMFLLFFYTDVFGITAAAAGTMFLVTRLWDALNDPLMGMIGDRTKTKWGKFRPYLLFVALPFAIIGILTFTTPDMNSSNKLIYAYVTYTLMMMVYTAINVPYASLLGVMTKDSKERTSLASFRFLGSFAGGLLVTATANSLIDYFSADADMAIGYRNTIAIYAVVAAIFFIFTFLGTKERLDPKEVKESSFKDDLQDLLQNKPWFIMLGATVSLLVFSSLKGNAILYYFKYYVGSQNVIFFGELEHGALSAAFMTSGQIAAILGVILVTPLAGKIGKKNTFLLSGLVCAVLCILFFFIPPHQIVFIFLINLFIAMSSGAVGPLIWSIYGDISDYSEWKTGRRATGLIFSSSSMSQKLGWTIGGAISGWTLSAFGFVANEIQTDESIMGIRLMISFFAAGGALLSVAFMYYYPLSEDYIIEIKEELEKNRSKTKSN
jgi:GPH family glycoside/pentoside/hexuronide:cation symporter